jgi:hypothetical protein
VVLSPTPLAPPVVVKPHAQLICSTNSSTSVGRGVLRIALVVS